MWIFDALDRDYLSSATQACCLGYKNAVENSNKWWWWWRWWWWWWWWWWCWWWGVLRCDEGDDTLPQVKKQTTITILRLPHRSSIGEQQLLCIILVIVIVARKKRTMIPKLNQKKLLLYHSFFRTGYYCRIMTLVAVTKMITGIENKLRCKRIKGMTTKYVAAFGFFQITPENR